MKTKGRKALIYKFLFCIVFILIGYIFINKYLEVNFYSQDDIYYNSQSVSTEDSKKIEENITNNNSYPKEKIIEEYKGYDVCAKLEIPIIELETYVLKNYSVQALNISVTKFWGVNPNEIGNFCVAGHNFINKNMFRNLKKLNIGDEIILTDNNIGQVQYEVFDVYKVIPEDTSCLFPVTEGERELTLITCTSDSQKRIIIKAKEVK